MSTSEDGGGGGGCGDGVGASRSGRNAKLGFDRGGNGLVGSVGVSDHVGDAVIGVDDDESELGIAGA